MENKFEITEKFEVIYEVRVGILNVSVVGKGSKSTQLGDMPPEVLASILARDIIKESRYSK